MTYLPAVVRAKYRGDWRLRITFSDGSENTIDFSEWLQGAVFEPLKDPRYFQKFFVDGGTVVWPNGADIAPETLYEVPGRTARSNRRLQPSKTRGAAAKKRTSSARLRG